MLLTKSVFIKWNSKIKKHYVDLGYEYTKMGDSFEVKVEHLTKGSNVKVDVECDYCKRISSVAWYSYVYLKEKSNNIDCCNNPSCTGRKAQESIFLLYGVNNSQKLSEVREKTKRTNLEKYGCENPFGNKDIQNKIRATNLVKFGVEIPTQNKEVRKKYEKTCLERYGVKNYGKLYSETHCKDKSPCWKGGVEYHRIERSSIEYRNWRKQVFDRDVYTCQCCGARNGHGHFVRLEAHHIYNWENNIDLRYSFQNGITLCSSCHKLFHSIYGLKNTNQQQLDTFISKFNEKNR